MITVVRVFLAALLTASVPSAAAPRCIGGEEFFGQGAKLLVQIGFNGTGSPTYLDLRCDRVGCSGHVDLEGTVDKNGVPHGVRVTHNSFSDHQRYKGFDRLQERFVRERLAAVRYVPPRLNGKSVCVKMQWRFSFEEGSARVNP